MKFNNDYKGIITDTNLTFQSKEEEKKLEDHLIKYF